MTQDLTTSEVAASRKVSRNLIYTMVDRGMLTPLNEARGGPQSYRFDAEEIERAFAERDKPRECGVGKDVILERFPQLTYRQLDYWTKTGRLHSHWHSKISAAAVPEQGSGLLRCWPMDQAVLIEKIFRLRDLGLDLATAERVAADDHEANDLIDRITEIALGVEHLTSA